jgi:hypothetical protein
MARKKKKVKVPKRRNMLALAMMMRHSKGASAGAHSQRGYNRKVKHKGKPSW